ncbi:ABC transporter substrate-binding protein [Evansella tamaricis]|uniref:ABC transporter substrate-binding protein n=1 Tax=Evansella tamaricis TaxID=2069301 RepID=A0ABS6JNB1_9BACI|nr:ABC transporter substrate-binding protein [Evansella tamaricis]MBU9713900.1 ABC transporter substrate-binding protein [Evansella tamaricis]
MKKWLLLLVAIFVAFAMVACSGDDEGASGDSDGDSGSSDTSGDSGETAGGSDAEPVELTFWTFGSTGYGKLIEEYKDVAPHVTINYNEGEMNDVHNNLFTSLSAGSGAPDIAMIEVSEVAKFLEASSQFHNLNDYGAQDHADNFLDWKWLQAQSVDGSFQLGFPTDIGPTTMFYRTDVIEEAGLPTDRESLSAEINTWDAFYEAAKTINEATGKPIADSPTLVFNAIRDQQPEQYFNENDELIIEDTVKDAYDFTTKMIQEGLVGKNSLWTPEWGSAMNDGTYAFLPGAPAWMHGVVKDNAPDAEGKWDIMAIPEGAGNWGGSFLTIPAESDHPQEAYDFIAWLTAPEQQVKSFLDMGLFPSAPAVFEDEEFLALEDEYFSGAPRAQIFAEAAESVVPVYMGVNYGTVNTEIETAIMNVAEGADPQEEWDAAVQRIEQQLGRQ